MKKPTEQDMVTRFCSLHFQSKPDDTILFCHFARLHFEFRNIQMINLLYLNMDGADYGNVWSYLTNLSQKPDLYIFLQLNEILGENLIGQLGATYEMKPHKKSGSTIVYNKNLFRVVDGPEKICNRPIIVWRIKHDRIVGNPEIIVAAFCNSSLEIQKCLIDKCLIDKYSQYPMLIAGGFNEELQKLLEETPGFQVPKCGVTIPRKLKVEHKLLDNYHTDFIAYRPSSCTPSSSGSASSSSTVNIKLEDVHSEPCPGLVTGSNGYNIAYNQLIHNLLMIKMAKHDPVRAKLTVT